MLSSDLTPDMQATKGSAGSDALRASVSSAPSTSSHGSQPDDCDGLGDVYVWGEIGPEKVITRGDVLAPRPLECSVVLDVDRIACGARHAALVTRQGEVFTWGEELGGRLGHGVGDDDITTQPRLVESLAFCDVDFVACGEFHTCAVTTFGEVYAWGDGTHRAGLLGDGAGSSRWVPKWVAGPLDGLYVASVACGPWHTALVTSGGRLFTFGDGTFGVLGHGDRESAPRPREVGSLTGLRTVAVACGVWHTAAVVEVDTAAARSGKLFTWGDGDKNRLGHGDREARLEPTCVPSLVDCSFHKVSCGHSLTVGLTTSGRVFAMGSTVYGQLGNPRADGKLPGLVEDKLAGETVDEISCGAYHVAVLTSTNEVYTWGKGANGRLGHGDVEDRKIPTHVETLKDRHVKFIACGSNYTAAICLHKWVVGAEQSQCSACRQPFGFTRKRHNCYNCGSVNCHSCSARKALRAALVPNPGKPHRVCDACYAKLSKVSEYGVGNNRRGVGPRLSGENKDKLAKSITPANYDMIKQLDTKAAKQGKKTSQARDSVRTVPRPILTQSNVSSRSASPFSRKSSPPRTAATLVPSSSGILFSKSVADGLKKTNEVLNQEMHKLRMQVDSLKDRCDMQEVEVRESAAKAREAMALSSEESAKCRAAKEVIKPLAAQVKDMAERLPPGAYDPDGLKLVYMPNGLEPNGSTHESHASIVSQEPSESPGNDQNGTNDHTDRSILSGSVEGDCNIKSRNSTPPAVHGGAGHFEAEWIEQYEPGVYITLVALRGGARDLKRVRFSRRRFGEHQAEKWWSENREKVYMKYNVRGSDKASAFGQAGRRSEGALSPSSQILGD